MSTSHNNVEWISQESLYPYETAAPNCTLSDTSEDDMDIQTDPSPTKSEQNLHFLNWLHEKDRETPCGVEDDGAQCSTNFVERLKDALTVGSVFKLTGVKITASTCDHSDTALELLYRTNILLR
ncbi:hypothetical protein QR680_008102 [Steinernema hermaphroditum]|uniref:Uncharacterized protein n=1 Tax=Steinernema hermaphroditum TaxID=289476 RepID=A0AA39IHI2_9BILA|nr:hypothetical protein QR680_008102 [Steinernema hermaphroditum]